jgi:hypothetical protein
MKRSRVAAHLPWGRYTSGSNTYNTGLISYTHYSRHGPFCQSEFQSELQSEFEVLSKIEAVPKPIPAILNSASAKEGTLLSQWAQIILKGLKSACHPGSWTPSKK